MDGSTQRRSGGHDSTPRARRIARSIGAGSVALILLASGASASYAGQGHYLPAQQMRGDVSQLSLVDPDEVPQVAVDAFAKLTSKQITDVAAVSGFDELDRNSQIELGKPINRYWLDESRGREWIEGRSEEIGGWELAVLYDHHNQFCAPATVNGAISQFYLCGDMFSNTQDPVAITDLVLDNFIKLDRVTASQQEAGFPGHIIELRSGFVYTDYVTVTALDSQSLTLIGQETADEDDFARKYFSELKERDQIDRSYRGSSVPLPLYNATPEQLEERAQALKAIEDSSPQSAMKRALGVGAIVLVVGLAVVALAYSLRRRDS